MSGKDDPPLKPELCGKDILSLSYMEASDYIPLERERDPLGQIYPRYIVRVYHNISFSRSLVRCGFSRRSTSANRYFDAGNSSTFKITDFLFSDPDPNFDRPKSCI